MTIKYRLHDWWWKFQRRYQRFKRGYAWSDVWNFDDWFIETIEPMLRHLQKEGVSYPLGRESDEWAKLLGQMADNLHLMSEENVINEVFNGNYMNPDIQKVMDEHKTKFFELFSENFYNLWD